MGTWRKWYNQYKDQILWTVIGAILSTLLGIICEYYFTGESKRPFNAVDFFKLTPQLNHFVQTLVIMISLVKLISIRRSILKDLESPNYIIDYLIDNCNIVRYSEDDDNTRLRIITKTVSQFYNGWILVWLLWLAYYMGNFLLVLIDNGGIPITHKTEGINNISQIIYSQIFDFLTSLTLLFIYIILNYPTVELSKRGFENDIFIKNCPIFIGIIVMFIIGLIHEAQVATIDDLELPNLISVSLSIFSALSFILVLGKINSNYLRIPKWFIVSMYVYAIIQCYVPLSQVHFGKDLFSISLIDVLIPYITLCGKVIVFLSLSWLGFEKRFIFFVIHKSTEMDNIPSQLAELNWTRVDED